VDLGALAAAIVADARIAEPEAHFALTEPTAPVIVAGDAGRLRQAIRNLVMNAAQVGGPGVHVTVGVAPADRGRARITVSDDGPGVPPELAARLFEPFVSGRTGGTGLGLAIALQVVERHAGTLVLDSPPGVRGATFSIYLPGRG
jgi:two-component system OmpR family sensor kinase